MGWSRAPANIIDGIERSTRSDAKTVSISSEYTFENLLLQSFGHILHAIVIDINRRRTTVFFVSFDCS